MSTVSLSILAVTALICPCSQYPRSKLRQYHACGIIRGMRNKTLTALKGVKVGHSTHPEKLTGCTVVIFEGDYPVAYVSNGGSPGTVATEDLNDGKDFGVRNGLFIARAEA